jgi:hypothetical protein
MKNLLKNDKYKKARGGYSRLLSIACEGCNRHLCDYQKDGPGILKRMYLDRISNSKKYSNLQNISENKIPQFKCMPCSRLLGVCINYEKENRLAYRLFVGAITKKIIKSTHQ